MFVPLSRRSYPMMSHNNALMNSSVLSWPQKLATECLKLNVICFERIAADCSTGGHGGPETAKLRWPYNKWADFAERRKRYDHLSPTLQYACQQGLMEPNYALSNIHNLNWIYVGGLAVNVCGDVVELTLAKLQRWLEWMYRPIDGDHAEEYALLQ